MTVPAIAVSRPAGGPGRAALPPLVLGPSLGTSAAALWGDCAALLADSFDVLAWDLPGHGSSPVPTGPFSIADLAAGVLMGLESEMGPLMPFSYAGDSVGAAVGLQLLLDHPDRVVAATLACTGARIGTPEGWIQRAALVRSSGTAALIDGSPARWFAPAFPAREPEVVERLLHSLRDADAAGYAWTCEALADFDVRDRLGEVAAPVLAVAGRHDVVTGEQTLRELADGITGARLVILDDVGHLAAAEDPRVLSALISSLSGDTPGRAGEDVRTAGMAVRRAVLGDAHVDRAVANTTDFTRDFQEFITRYAWGSIWTRPGLDRRTRSLTTLAIMVARGHHDEFALHVRAARTNGVTVDEIKELLLQTAVYCGVPDANTAFAIASRVLADLDGGVTP